MDAVWKKLRMPGYVFAILFLTVPSLVITFYAYPCQDDFHYAFYAREMMAEGHSLLYTAMYWTIEYYKTFSGCYTSTFLGYFFSGILNCNIWGIRIFEFCSLLLFYGALYVFLHAVAYKLMGFPRKRLMPFYCILLAMFNGLIYYGWHEAFYWFITSVQYLMIMSIIILGISFFVFALYEDEKTKRMVFLVLASVFGFLGSGGTLSIAAFCCALYLLMALWGIADRKQIKASCAVMGITLFGAIINGVSPGNYQRAGEPKTMVDVLYAAKMSAKYMLERGEALAKKPIFWIILILLFLLVFSSGRQRGGYTFRLPVIFLLMLPCIVSGIIFPAVLGYGYDVYGMLMRGNFVSDAAIYLCIFIGIFYLKGWMDVRYVEISRKFANRATMMITGVIIMTLLICAGREWRDIPVLAEYQQLADGSFAEFSDFCMDVYRQIEESEGDIAEAHADFVEQRVCLIGPQFMEGWYDPGEVYGNQTIARFYGKRAAYVYYN